MIEKIFKRKEVDEDKKLTVLEFFAKPKNIGKGKRKGQE